MHLQLLYKDHHQKTSPVFLLPDSPLVLETNFLSNGRLNNMLSGPPAKHPPSGPGVRFMPQGYSGVGIGDALLQKMHRLIRLRHNTILSPKLLWVNSCSHHGEGGVLLLFQALPTGSSSSARFPLR